MSYGNGGNPYGSPGQQQYGSPGQQRNDSPIEQYSTPYSGGGSGYQSVPATGGFSGGYDNGYEEHELQSYGASQPFTGSATLPVVDFLNRITELREQIEGIDRDTEGLRRVQDAAMQQSDATAARGEIEARTAGIRDQVRAIKAELAERLADDARHTQNVTEFNTKKNQLDAALSRFKQVSNNLRKVEEDYRTRFRGQLVRQYQIVNPGASNAEAENFIDNSDNQNIFEQAVQSSRVGQARTVLGNVRAQHEDLVRVEESIIELVELMNELDSMIIKQEVIVMQVEEQAVGINDNVKEGNVQIDHGIKSAKNRRKLKWWCLLVVVLIVLAIALGVGLGIALNTNKGGGNNNTNKNNGNN